MYNLTVPAAGSGGDKTTNNSSGGTDAGRIHILDLWRSVCVWIMLVYHAAFDLTLFGVLPGAVLAHPAAELLRWFGAGSFILISGICARRSRNPVRRGILVFCAGMLVTLATTLAGYPVAFGVLHLLGCCMVLYGLLRQRVEACGSTAFAAACLALFAGTWLLTSRTTVDLAFLFPLGFRRADFFSADYFPLLPWAFLFLFGTALGKTLDARRDLPLLQRRFPPLLTFCGRHSLIIYLLHQPLIYGICRLLFS